MAVFRSIGCAICFAVVPAAASGQSDTSTKQVTPSEQSTSENWESSVGLSKQRPTSGRFVEVDNRYMVSYEQRLPGSDSFIRLQPIPGGTFVVPADVAGGKSEDIQIPPMWMAEYEVSWGQYSEFMNLYRGIKEISHGKRDARNESVDAVSAPTELYDPSIHLPFAKSPLQPATGMTQYGARQFTKWLSLRSRLQYRLPGENEWTYACIGGDSSMLTRPMDRKELQRVACFDNLPNGASLAGSFAANSFGLHDMLGNAAEWVITQRDHGITANWPPVQKQLLGIEERCGQLACGGNWMDYAAECQPLSRIVCSDDWWEDDPDVPMSTFWHANEEYSATVGFRICRQYKTLPRTQIQQYWDAPSRELRQDDDIRIEGGRGARAVITDEIQEAAKRDPVLSHRYWERNK